MLMDSRWRIEIIEAKIFLILLFRRRKNKAKKKPARHEDAGATINNEKKFFPICMSSGINYLSFLEESRAVQ
jgi:hypothetical protein